jgi:hypothetical protein
MISRPLDEEVIFHIARRIADRQARADYLEQVCGDNTALLTRVRALLEVHEQEQDFLRSAGPEATATLDAILVVAKNAVRNNVGGPGVRAVDRECAVSRF